MSKLNLHKQIIFHCKDKICMTVVMCMPMSLHVCAYVTPLSISASSVQTFRLFVSLKQLDRQSTNNSFNSKHFYDDSFSPNSK